MMTSAQVFETSVTITDNSPYKNYTHPDDLVYAPPPPALKKIQ